MDLWRRLAHLRSCAACAVADDDVTVFLSKSLTTESAGEVRGGGGNATAAVDASQNSAPLAKPSTSATLTGIRMSQTSPQSTAESLVRIQDLWRAAARWAEGGRSVFVFDLGFVDLVSKRLTLRAGADANDVDKATGGAQQELRSIGSPAMPCGAQCGRCRRDARRVGSSTRWCWERSCKSSTRRRRTRVGAPVCLGRQGCS